MENRSIMHNIMISEELARHHNRKNISSSCIMKVDLRTEYDTVSWGFLELLLFAKTGQVIFVGQSNNPSIYTYNAGTKLHTDAVSLLFFSNSKLIKYERERTNL